MTLDQFVALSSALTGYPAGVLLPVRNTQHIPELLFAQLSLESNNIPAAQLDQLTQVWAGIASIKPQAALEAAVQEKIINDPAISRLAQNIIYLWYVGIWYDLAKDPASFAPGNDHVVDPLTYTNGLVWGEMGAHPMGFSTGTFGYWAETPVLPAIS